MEHAPIVEDCFVSSAYNETKTYSMADQAAAELYTEATCRRDARSHSTSLQLYTIPPITLGHPGLHILVIYHNCSIVLA